MSSSFFHGLTLKAQIRPTRNLPALGKVEDRIANRLRAASKGTPDYWDFRDGAEELASKCLFQYPAMMVPALQRKVIAAILTARPGIQTIADPFLGSGTVLALAMLSGRSFIGQDINPLAILIAKTRAFSLDHVSLTEACNRVNSMANEDRWTCYDVRFKRQAKWFTRGASVGLSRLHRAIRTEADIHTRRFLWVSLAETVRLNSNSRTSTYKLHVRPEADRTATIKDVLTSFKQITTRNLDIVADFRSELERSGHLDAEGNYKYFITISYGDSAEHFPIRRGDSELDYELVVTSPPYGDNKTTVPYGQAAWLPLQWIDIKDIDPAIPGAVAKGYYDVDNCSLGGRRPRTFCERQKALQEIGTHTNDYIAKLASVSREGLSRFVNFAHDLRNATAWFAGHCAAGGYVVLTLGHRNICGTVCPLSEVCRELLSEHNAEEIIRITRQISSKRMPGKNGHSATINHEYISLFYKSQREPNKEIAIQA